MSARPPGPRVWRPCLLLGLVVTSACGSATTRGVEAPTTEASLEQDGWTRTYRLHVPRAYDGRTALPLVVVLHGGGSSGTSMEETTGFSRLAERERFVVAYPDGLGAPLGMGRAWNAGDCCGRAQMLGVDDVAFVRGLIERLRSELSIDDDRIFVVGYSNSAVLTYRIGSELGDRVAAIAPFAGTMSGRGPPAAPRFDLGFPTRPVSVIALHGTSDPWVPYEGKEKSEGLDVSFAQAGRFWALAAGCQRTSRRTERGGAVVFDEYQGCAHGAAVTQVTLVGWNHEWPGGANTRELESNHPLHDFDAAEIIWRFFASHPRAY